MEASAGKVPFNCPNLCRSMPSITISSIIHNSGCGVSKVTRTIMYLLQSGTNPRNGYRRRFTSSVRIRCAKTRLASQTALMRAQELTFAGDKFTDSIMNVSFFTSQMQTPYKLARRDLPHAATRRCCNYTRLGRSPSSHAIACGT
jgi:hypothetical protein